jgi:alpha-tubulin suppressor-like RCC1 family protein
VDCDDGDPDNYVSCASCVDLDGDLWFIGCDLYGQRSGPDCDDFVINAQDDCGDCVDSDGDGRGTGATCTGPGDCDDGLVNAWSDCGDCPDSDGDGHGAGASCDGPADCNDTLANAWADCADCDDIDGDGWGAGTSCSGPEDCDEGLESVHPGAPEICDGIDNHCPGDAGYGIMDEGCIAVDLAAGGFHTCAAITDGSVKCWGFNANGQLGHGSTVLHSNTPVIVESLSNAVSVTAGRDHTCAVLSDGGLMCWGANGYGQLGDGSTADRQSPVQAAVGDSVRSVSAGGMHTCAALFGGSVNCWGYNAYGQLGHGDTAPYSAFPVTAGIGGDGEAIDVAGGGAHTCAVLSGGSAFCWGLNNYGQLGNGGTVILSSAPAPVQLSGSSIAVETAAGWFHSCAGLDDGSLRCWGDNRSGQLGDGQAISDSNLPLAVLLSGDTASLETDGGGDSQWAHTCALLADGGVRCWGENGYGQLGDDNAPVDSGVPVVPVLGITAEKAVTGTFHSCAFLSNGTIKCWGYNLYGQLGDGSEDNSAVPVSVIEISP